MLELWERQAKDQGVAADEAYRFEDAINTISKTVGGVAGKAKYLVENDPTYRVLHRFYS